MKNETMKRDSYHHGNLRYVLLKTSHRLLQKRGPILFSIREVAQQSGVSHTAIYRHFQDKDSILEELARTGFLRLASLQKKASRFQNNPAGYIQPLGMAYIQFALKNPNYYRLMFQTQKKQESLGLKRAKLQSYAVLVHGCRYYLRERKNPEAPRRFALMCWSLVHGYSNLAIETDFPKDEASVLDRTVLQMAEEVLGLIVSN